MRPPNLACLLTKLGGALSTLAAVYPPHRFAGFSISPNPRFTALVYSSSASFLFFLSAHSHPCSAIPNFSLLYRSLSYSSRSSPRPLLLSIRMSPLSHISLSLLSLAFEAVLNTLQDLSCLKFKSFYLTCSCHFPIPASPRQLTPRCAFFFY